MRKFEAAGLLGLNHSAHGILFGGIELLKEANQAS